MNNSSSEAETQMRNNDHDDNKPLPNRPRQDETAEDIKPWGILIFGLMGATVTTFADQWLTGSNSCGLREDLVIEQILSRLPVKSLMRFKSVCKRWHALPTDPSFIGSHLKHINNPSRLVSWNGNYNGLLFKHDGFQVFRVDYLPRGFDPVNLNFGFDRVPDIVLGPCEGIFCLYWTPTGCHGRPRPGVERLPTLLLWNPATRAFSILPKSRFDFPPYKKVHGCIVGFGFDRTTKSIKVVKVVGFRRDEYTPNEYINCAEVYEVGSGSWRVLCADDILQKIHVYNGFSMYDTNDGVFHWCSSLSVLDPVDNGWVELVLSFDMSSELFHMTLMPEKYYKASGPLNKLCYPLLLRDSFAVSFSFLNTACHTTVVELWVMKKDFDRVVKTGTPSSYSWSHELTEELSSPGIFPCLLIGFLSKNELLLQMSGFGGPMVLYDIVTKQARDFSFQVNRIFCTEKAYFHQREDVEVTSLRIPALDINEINPFTRHSTTVAVMFMICGY